MSSKVRSLDREARGLRMEKEDIERVSPLFFHEISQFPTSQRNLVLRRIVEDDINDLKIRQWIWDRVWATLLNFNQLCPECTQFTVLLSSGEGVSRNGIGVTDVTLVLNLMLLGYLLTDLSTMLQKVIRWLLFWCSQCHQQQYFSELFSCSYRTNYTRQTAKTPYFKPFAAKKMCDGCGNKLKTRIEWVFFILHRAPF